MRKIPYHGGSLKAELQGALLQRKYFDALFSKKGPNIVIIHNISPVMSHREIVTGVAYFDCIFLCFHGQNLFLNQLIKQTRFL